MSAVTRAPYTYTRDQLISKWHSDLPADYIRNRVRQLLRRHRGCRAGQRRKTRLQFCRHSTHGVDDGRIPVIIGNRPTAVPLAGGGAKSSGRKLDKLPTKLSQTAA